MNTGLASPAPAAAHVHPQITIRTTSGASTGRVGAALAALLGPGHVIALHGPLGAGKTRFTTGLVQSLPGGAGLRVQSPTFAIAKRYKTTPAVHHIDLYRLEGPDMADELGVTDAMDPGQLADEGALACVEWPSIAPDLFAADTVWVVFSENPSRNRRLMISGAPLVARGLTEVHAALERAARGR